MNDGAKLCWPCLLGGGGVLLVAIAFFGAWIMPLLREL